MSYLARLKRQISANAPASEATKGTKGAFDTYVAPGQALSRQFTAGDDVQTDPAADARRQRAIAILAGDPGIRYAVVTDIAADPEAVILTLGIRDLATGELLIPRASYDPFRLMQLMDEYAGGPAR